MFEDLNHSEWDIEHWRYRFIRVCYMKTGYCKYPQIHGLDINLPQSEIEIWSSDLKNWALNQTDGDFRSTVHFMVFLAIQNWIQHIFKTLVCVNVWYIKIPLFRKSFFSMKMAIPNVWITPKWGFHPRVVGASTEDCPTHACGKPYTINSFLLPSLSDTSPKSGCSWLGIVPLNISSKEV